MYKSFRPGKVWYDTEGKRIQAHGGSILFHDGIYYWYGENKDGITGLATGERCPYWHHGVRLYSSNDLYNWKDEGIIMKESKDKNNPFYPGNIMDRPHILYNEKNHQFVMWSKTSNQMDFGQCSFSICVASDIHEFTLVKQIRPGGYTVGDFDLFIKDGKAYVAFEYPHSEMIIQQLTDDYMDVVDKGSAHLQAECPPFVREAPAYFTHDGKDYILSSGTTGYFANPSRIALIKDIHGEWVDLGKCCVNDKNNNSFHAQFSSVFHHPYIKDLYIALGDRWLTDTVEDLPDMEDEFYKLFSDKFKDKITREELNKLTDENTSEANYVWLPIKFDESGKPYIAYMREWQY